MQTTIEQAISEVLSAKAKLSDAKMILKHYKVSSPMLSQLTNAYKELKRQINDEKDRIREEFLEDVDYVQAEKDVLTYGSELKEKKANLKGIMKGKSQSPADDVETFRVEVNGEQMVIQLEHGFNVYLNGNK